MLPPPLSLPIYLLSRSWRDAPDGVRVELWGHSERGPVHVVLERQHAVMFVDRELEAPCAGRRRAVQLRSLQGRPVDALYFRKQRDLVSERQRLRSAGVEPLEAAHGGFVTSSAVRQRAVAGPILPLPRCPG